MKNNNLYLTITLLSLCLIEVNTINSMSIAAPKISRQAASALLRQQLTRPAYQTQRGFTTYSIKQNSIQQPTQQTWLGNFWNGLKAKFYPWQAPKTTTVQQATITPVKTLVIQENSVAPTIETATIPVKSLVTQEDVTPYINYVKTVLSNPRDPVELSRAKRSIDDKYREALQEDKLYHNGKISDTTQQLLNLSMQLYDDKDATQEELKNEALDIYPAHLQADIEFAKKALKAGNLQDIKNAQEVINTAYMISQSYDARFNNGEWTKNTRNLLELWLKLDRAQNKLVNHIN